MKHAVKGDKDLIEKLRNEDIDLSCPNCGESEVYVDFSMFTCVLDVRCKKCNEMIVNEVNIYS